MFYKQTIVDIELVILTLDGGLLDLNRLRYNYFKRLCKKQNRDVPIDQYVDQLGCYKTMYDAYGLDHEVMDNMIENDLFSYVNLKEDIKKDGVDELLQFLKQKNIKVAVISTHKTRQAIGYLQLAGIYDFVDFIVGGDTDFDVFPSNEVVEDIAMQMGISKRKTLIVANFPSLLKAANDSKMNVIYVQDLIEIESRRNTAAFDVVKNYLELINIFLFSKYDDIEMYSKVLGMSKDMDLVTLENTYRQLLIEYHNDEQLLDIVKRSYKYYLLEINYEENKFKEATIKKQNSIHSTMINESRFAAFEDVDLNINLQPQSSIEQDLPDLSSFLPESFSQSAKELGAMVDRINSQRSSVIENISKEQETLQASSVIGAIGVESEDVNLNNAMNPSVVPSEHNVNSLNVESTVDNSVSKPNEELSQTLILSKVEEVIKPEKELKKDIKILKKQKQLDKQLDNDKHESTSLDFSFIRKSKSLKEVEITDASADNVPFTSIDVQDNLSNSLPSNKLAPSMIKEAPKKEKNQKEKVIKPKRKIEFKISVFDILYSLFISFIVVLGSMFGYICFKDYLGEPSFISNLISNSCGIYLMFGEFLLSSLFNIMNSIISIIPSYDTLMQGNELISALAIQMIWFTLLGNIFGYFLKKGSTSLMVQIQNELIQNKQKANV